MKSLLIHLVLSLPITASAIAIAEPVSETSLALEERTGFKPIACEIVNHNANCRTCDSTSCASIELLSLGKTYDFDCACHGEDVDGISYVCASGWNRVID